MSFYQSSLGKIISDTPCPHCSKQSTYEGVTHENDYISNQTLVWDRLGASFPYQIRFSIYRCENCNHFRTIGERIKNGYENRKIFEYPLPGFSGIDRGKVHHVLILDGLDEGIRCLHANSAKGAIVNFRRALQAAVLILGGKGENLEQQINDLHKKEVIRVKTRNIAHKVRAFGNLGAHPYEIKIDEGGVVMIDDFSELTLDDATQAAKMLLLFLEDAFVFSSELDDMDQRLNELKT